MRLDVALADQGLVQSRSRAESDVKLGLVKVNGKVVTKPSYQVNQTDEIRVAGDQYVSRAALKLASIAQDFQLDFRGQTVLDVGSSTGGFTDYALQHGAKKVIAVDVGTDQLHPSLLGDERIELHEKTDVRRLRFRGSKMEDRGTKKGGRREVTGEGYENKVVYIESPDIIVIDVSFISLRKILPHVSLLARHQSRILAMLKPQFEAGKDQVNKGVIKNSKIRRQILKEFEEWLNINGFVILDKADSKVAGTKGNVERFYKLKLSK